MSDWSLELFKENGTTVDDYYPMPAAWITALRGKEYNKYHFVLII